MGDFYVFIQYYDKDKNTLPDGGENSRVDGRKSIQRIISETQHSMQLRANGHRRGVYKFQDKVYGRVMKLVRIDVGERKQIPLSDYFPLDNNVTND